MKRVLVVVCIVSLGAGCTLVEAYPPATNETGELCSNDVDDDLDGAFDCDDEGCAGPSCTEETDAQCRNGRDDDGDGLFDEQDAACFRFARMDVTRCVPIGPTDFAPSFGTPGETVLDSGWRAVSPIGPTLEPDPGDPTRLVARSPTEGAVLASDPLAGALVGLRMSFEIFAPSGVLTSIGLVVEGDPGTIAPDGMQVLVDEMGNVLLAGSGVILYVFPVPLPMPGEGRHVSGTLGVARHVDASGAELVPRMTADLHIDGRQVMFDAPRANPFVGRAPGEVSTALTDGAPVRARFLATGEGALLVSASAHADAFNPCIRDGSAPTSPLLPHPVIGLARVSSGVCAITRDTPTPTVATRTISYVSPDDGLHWEPGGLVVDLEALGLTSLGASELEVTDVALVQTDTGAVAGVAAITRVLDGRIALLRLVESEDCITWHDAPSGFDDALLPDLNARAVSYGVAELDGAPNVHEITLVELGGTADGSIVRATSPSGAAGSWQLLPDTTAMPRPADWIHQLFNGLRFHRLGDDRILVFGDSHGIRAYVEDAGGWTLLDEPLLAPSGVTGTLDVSAVAFPIVVFDRTAPGEPLRGLVAHSGSGVSGTCPACDLASVVEPFEITPR